MADVMGVFHICTLLILLVLAFKPFDSYRFDKKSSVGDDIGHISIALYLYSQNGCQQARERTFTFYLSHLDCFAE